MYDDKSRHPMSLWTLRAKLINSTFSARLAFQLTWTIVKFLKLMLITHVKMSKYTAGEPIFEVFVIYIFQSASKLR